MVQYVVWLDSEKAKIFNLKTSGIERSHMEKHTHDHHQRDKHNQHTNPDEDHFFHSLAEKLRDGDKILLMGPGMAKKHFMTHLQTKHHHGLDAKVVGVENADHPTDNQILEIARKFFHTYNLFHT